MRLKLIEKREVLENTSLEIGSKEVFNYPHTREAINSIIANLTTNTIDSQDLEVIKSTDGKLKKFSKEDPSIMYSIELREEGNPLTNYLIIEKVKLTCKWENKICLKKKKA